ncbi:hypothetical protein ACP70R_019097 [Stipagrostis hirtigluma subsp. patula]
MPLLDDNRSGATADGADDDDDDDAAGAPGGGQRCSCLPFCFWAGSSRPRRAASGGAGADPGRSRRRRWRRLRFRLRLPWFAWLTKIRKKEEVDGDAGTKKGKKRRCRRLLLLLTASLQAKKALASVVSGDGALLPAKVSSFGDDAKKQNRSKPSPTADITAPSSSSEQPQPSTTTATSARGSATTARARALPPTSQPCRNTADEPAAAATGRAWRAPSRRQLCSAGRRPAGAGGGLWTAATTLGVIVLFGRVTAVVFLCSCLYGARFVRARVTGAGARAGKAHTKGGVAGAAIVTSSRRSGDPVAVGADAEKAAEPYATEECKKKVVMAGLLERASRRPSSRFGR